MGNAVVAGQLNTSMFLLFVMNSWNHISSINMTRTPRRPPLLSFSGIELRSVTSVVNTSPLHDDSDAPRKPWYHYLPLCGTFVIRYLKNMTFNSTIYRNRNNVIGAASILALCSCRLSFTNYAPALHFHYPPIGYIYPNVYDLLIPHYMCGSRPRSRPSSHIPVRRSRRGGNGPYRSLDARPRFWISRKMVPQMLGTWQDSNIVIGNESTKLMWRRPSRRGLITVRHAVDVS